VFRNSSLIYSDEIGGLVASMGFKGMLTEGAKADALLHGSSLR